MAQYKITLIGLENYLNPEHSVFENMMLPDGIDKEILVGAIMLRCQEFELLYSDPDFMTDAVNVWSRKNFWTFEKWAKLLNMKYEPLYNKDYYEESSDSHDGDYKKNLNSTSSGESSESSDFTRTDNLSHSADFTRTDNLSHSSDFTRTDNLASTNDTTVTHSEKAYNSSGYVGTTQDVTDQDTSNTGTQRNAGTESNTGTQRNAGTESNTGNQRNAGSIGSTYEDTSTNGETGNDSYENTHKYHGFGNIGIMSSQQLWLQEADLAKWNMYEHIADLFATEFCIMVY